ncbi:MAG: hypothetical protein J2O39_00325 [Acidimicrobiales bacterium]|nr:hypothetical protein [Acidimicrobiales bacterium]MBO0892796.1 hypothetical protein [Acidimicrobiales bacterium]
MGRAWRFVRRAFTLGIGAGIGALISYYWDPERGPARRARQAEQLQTAARQQRSAVERQARQVSERLKGATATAPTPTDGANAPASDQVVVERDGG